MAVDPVTGADLPAELIPQGTSFPSSEAGLTLQRLSGNRLRITADDRVTTYLVAGQVPGLTVSPALTVTVAVLRPGVVQLPDSRVAFPSTEMAPGTGEPITGPLVGAAGVGPFTWDEVLARVTAPNGEITVASLSELDQIEFTYPVVIDDDGVVPEIGDLVVGTGASGVSGVVVGTPPPLRRGGHVLLTVQILGPAQLFRDLHYDITYERLVQLGLVERPEPLVLPTNPQTVDPTTTTVGGFGPLSASLPSRLTRQLQAQRPAQNDPVTTPDPGTTPTTAPDPGTPDALSSASSGTLQKGGFWRNKAATCGRELIRNGTWDVGALEVAPFSDVRIAPVFNVLLDVSGFTVNNAIVELGGTLTATFKASVKVRAAATVSSECELGDFEELRINMPGALSTLLGMFLGGQLKFKPSMKVEGGPQLEAGIQCTLAVNLIWGMTYSDATGMADRSRADTAGSNCDPIWNVGSGTLEDSAPAMYVEPVLLVEIAWPSGMSVGGLTGRWIARVLTLFGLGTPNMFDAKFLEMAAGPQLRLAWETMANTLLNRSAQTFAGAEWVMKGSLKVEPIVWVMKKFTGTFDLSPLRSKRFPTASAPTTTNEFEIVFISMKFPLGTAYSPLNTKGIEAEVEGRTVDVSRTVYVEEGDQLVLTSPLAPASGGGEVGTPQLTRAFVHLGAPGPVSGTWARTTLLGSPTIKAATGADAALGNTVIALTTTITPEACAQLRDEQKVAIVGDAPLGFGPLSVPAPAWGGTFEVKCVDGKLAWDRTDITGVAPGDVFEVTLTSSGSKADAITINGADVPWLSVVPSEPIEVKPLGELADGQEEEEFTVTIGGMDDGRVRTCAAPRTAVLVATTASRGQQSLTIVEHDQCYVRWTSETLTSSGGTEVAVLTQEGPTGSFVQLDEIIAALPDWAKLVSPVSQVEFLRTISELPPDTTTVPDGMHLGPQSILFTFEFAQREATCVNQPPLTHDVVLRTAVRGTATLHLVSPEVPAREDCGLHFDPKRLSGHGVSTLKLVDDSVAPAGRFAIVHIDAQQVPEWMTVDPMFFRLADEGTQPVVVLGSPPFDRCEGRNARTVPVYAEATMPYRENAEGDAVAVGETKTTTATLFVDYPAIAPSNDPSCTPRISDAGGHGDPHMYSFDGVHWEGQTVGEYVYAERGSSPTSPAIRITARHTPTNGNAPATSSPTSIRAVAVEVGDAKVELYVGVTPGSATVRIDGVETPLTDGGVASAAEALSISRSGSTYLVSADDVLVKVTSYGGIFDVNVRAPHDSGLRGLLGSPNGDRLDDFVGRDGTVYTATQIAGFDHPVEFEAFVHSWRVLDRAASPFTNTYADFAAPNPGFDLDVITTYAAQVDAFLAGIADVCATPPVFGVRERYAMALELSIGTPVSELERFSCRYAVTGVVTSGEAPVPGVEVTVDGDGVRPCTVTTGLDGRYHCVVSPDLDEAADNAPIGLDDPLVVGVVAMWPGRTGVIANGTARFGVRAPSDGTARTDEVDLVVDPAAVPTLVITGSVRIDGVGQRAPRVVEVHARDAAERDVLRTWVTVNPDADGAFTLRVALPITAATADAVMEVNTGVIERISRHIDGIVPGPNALLLDAELVPVRVRVVGTLSVNGVPVTTPQTIRLAVRTPGGILSYFQESVVTPAANGSYSASFVAPSNALSAFASVRLGTVQQLFDSTEVTVGPGTTELALDAAFGAPVLSVAGSIVGPDGSPANPTASVSVRWYAGTTLLASMPSSTASVGADGRFAAVLDGPQGADRAVITARLSTLGNLPDDTELEVTGLTPGPRVVDFPIVWNPVVIAVTGRALDAVTGLPLTGGASIETFAFDSAGRILGTRFDSVQLAADGTYAYTLRLDHRVVRAELRGRIGPDLFSKVVTGLTPGTNPIVFDLGVSAPTVVVSGRLTTGAPPTRVAPTVRLLMEGRAGGGALVFSREQAVTLEPDGSYTLSQQLPMSVNSVTVTAKVGGGANLWSSDWPTITAAVTPGTNLLPLDSHYDPAVIDVSGVAFVDGVALDRVALEITSFANGDLTRVDRFQTFIAPVVSGRYQQSIVLPLDTTSFSILVRDVADTVYAYEIVDQVSQGERVERIIDLDVRPAYVTVRGVATFFDEPVRQSAVTVSADAYDAAGNLIGRDRDWAGDSDVPDEFRADLVLPQGTRSVELRAELFLIGEGFSQIVPLTPQRFDGIVDGQNPDIRYDPGVRSLTLDGSITREGQPVGDLGTSLPTRVTVRSPRGDRIISDDIVYDDTTGQLSGFVLFDPLATEVTFELVGVPGAVPLVVVPTEPRGIATWTVELPPAGDVRTVHIGGSLPPDTDLSGVRVLVQAISIDVAQFRSDPPWTLVRSADEQAQATAEPDRYELVLDVPVDSDLLVVEVQIDGEPGRQQVIELERGTDPVDVVHDVATGRWISFDYRPIGDPNNPDCRVTSFVTQVTIWWFPAQPADTSNGDPSTWPDGIPLGTELVVPGVDGIARHRRTLPGNGWINVGLEPWSRYDGRFNTSAGFSLPVTGDVGFGFGDFPFGCASIG